MQDNDRYIKEDDRKRVGSGEKAKRNQRLLGREREQERTYATLIYLVHGQNSHALHDQVYVLIGYKQETKTASIK